MTTHPIYRRVGALVRDRRKALGLTQDKLAQQLVISRASLANIETGRQGVLLHQIYEIASALELQPTDLLPRVEEPKKVNGEGLPFPKGLKAEQRDQIARLLANFDIDVVL